MSGAESRSEIMSRQYPMGPDKGGPRVWGWRHLRGVPRGVGAVAVRLTVERPAGRPERYTQKRELICLIRDKA